MGSTASKRTIFLPAFARKAAPLLLFLFSLAGFSQSPAPARYTVLLDAAHGGEDAGARLNFGGQQNQPEKTFVLAFAGRLRALLSVRGIAVAVTREGDLSLDAGRRAEAANRAHANACLSLHASMTGKGVHLYVSSLAPGTQSRGAAWKTAQAGSVTRSLKLAGDLNSALSHAGLPVTLGRTALPGLDSMACPAVAIEVAPLAGAKPAALNDQAYLARIANALAAALVQWRTEEQP